MTEDEMELLYLLYVESKGGTITEADHVEMVQSLEAAFPNRDHAFVSFEEARAALGV